MTENYDIHPVLRSILSQRGITEEADLREFLSPSPQRTYDPMLMKGMDEASDLILSYAGSGRKICIYGDYDSDGINSVTLLLLLLRNLTDQVSYYIPSRFSEGYGLNRNAIDRICGDGTELIITVDNGCVAHDEVEYIKQLGMAVIVTDHHNIDDRAADCIMLNPKQKDDAYPFKHLCGCGVAFKLAQVITRKAGLSRRIQNDFLDLAAIATVGDIVPLVDENRTIVKHGLRWIRRRSRPGVSAILDEMKVRPETVDAERIAFGIVPRLNSCGRMAEADLGVRLLTGQDDRQIRQLAEQLGSFNRERRRVQEQTFRTAKEEIEATMAGSRFLLYDAGGAHEGITGIVAGKLKDTFYRPTVIVTDMPEDGLVKGTGRSIPGVDLYALLKEQEHFFVRFGGHAGACGFTMRKTDVEELRRRLNLRVRQMEEEHPDLLKYRIPVDADMDASEVSLELAEQLTAMEPFGEGNPVPVFRVSGVQVSSVRRMGSEQQYRRLSCAAENGNRFDAVVFDTGLAPAMDALEGMLCTLIAEIRINTWNGRKNVQLVVRGREEGGRNLL